MTSFPRPKVVGDHLYYGGRVAFCATPLWYLTWSLVLAVNYICSERVRRWADLHEHITVFVGLGVINLFRRLVCLPALRYGPDTDDIECGVGTSDLFVSDAMGAQN